MDTDKVIEHIFCCPGDRGGLTVTSHRLKCTVCGTEYLRLQPRLFELKTPQPKAVDSTVQQDYEAIYSEPFRLEGQPPGWGDLATANPGKRAFVQRERQAISDLLGACGRGVVVDVSGGSGNYSGFLAGQAQTMIHCDVHMPSLAQAFRDQSHHANLYFARGDYLSLPLRDASVDGAMCTDTLIRGDRHDRALLGEMRRVLKTNGRAVVDFHNHRFKRFQKRSPLARCYDLTGFLQLVEDCGFAVERVKGIGYVPTRAVPWEWAYGLLDGLLRLFVSPSRYLVVLARQG